MKRLHFNKGIDYKNIVNETQTYTNMKGKKIVTINSTIPLLWKEEIIGALEIARDITYLKGLSDQL